MKAPGRPRPTLGELSEETYRQAIAAPPPTILLEPLLLLDQVDAAEVLVTLGQVDDALDDADDVHDAPADAAGQQRHQQHDDARGGEAEDELVNPEAAQQDGQDAGRH